MARVHKGTTRGGRIWEYQLNAVNFGGWKLWLVCRSLTTQPRVAIFGLRAADRLEARRSGGNTTPWICPF